MTGKPSISRRVIAAVATVICIVVIKLYLHPSIPKASAAEPTDWVEEKRNQPVLTIDEPPFSMEVSSNTSYKHPNGSLSDWIVAGSLAAEAPNLTIMISRQTQPEPIRYSLVRNLEDLSELKLTRHRYKPFYYAMTTRYGDLRGVTLDVNADGLQKFCVGFHKPVSNRIFVKGIVCSANKSDVTPEKVACIIDHVRFANPQDEQAALSSLSDGDAKPCGAKLMNGTQPAPSPESKQTL
ncbi:MAG: hypothetical protein K2W78_05055 [Xanthobacteraceae bacterium]|nr:hypothetical protein [Xanthobacteraceae bacterium]